jgi:hypothetical protein
MADAAGRGARWAARWPAEEAVLYDEKLDCLIRESSSHHAESVLLIAESLYA